MITVQDDEYMLVRIKDNAVVINRLFLTDTGISQRPCHAEKENEELAKCVNGWLEREKAGRVSFGKYLHDYKQI